MACLWFPHVGFTPRGENHATFSVDRDRQIIAELRQQLKQKRVVPEKDDYQREQTLENFEIERQEIKSEGEEIKSRVEDLRVFHQNLEPEQETLVRAHGSLYCDNEQYRAELQAKFDLEQQKFEQVVRDLRGDRRELKLGMQNVMEGQNELERGREWLQEERLEFGRAQRQAQLDLKESQQKLMQERERLREDRLRFEEVRNELAHANLKHGQILDKKSKQLDEDRLEIVRKRRELDRGLRELTEEGGWSFGEEDDDEEARG